jgi:hypothetical protein
MVLVMIDDLRRPLAGCLTFILSLIVCSVVSCQVVHDIIPDRVWNMPHDEVNNAIARDSAIAGYHMGGFLVSVVVSLVLSVFIAMTTHKGG